MRVSTSSGQKSADAAITSRPALITAVTVLPGADAATIELYDNSAASGTILAKVQAATGSSRTETFNHPIQANTAIFAHIAAGTSPSYIVHYSLE